MSNVDERIVRMMFDNSDFERGIRTSLSSLSQLQHGLQLPGASRGLNEISAVASKGLSLGHISAGIDKISSRFSAMSVIGIAALSTIASRAAIVGLQVAKSLSIKPVLDGFADYELKIGATQNIMAGTGESIGVVSKYLKELDIYADQTIYNLRDMTSNIGKFTNAGVKLPVAVEAMKGIANLAALSGASSEEAARAMYNLGQAIGQGSVRLMDWKSVELANMGTIGFKQQLIDTGVAMGTLTKATNGSLKTSKGHLVTTKNFTTTLADQWLTADVLTKTLQNYSSRTTDVGKRAWKAATEVKTLSMMSETLKASAGTGWTDTFEIALGTLPEATKVLTSLTNVIGSFINASANARNKVLGDWKALGGRTAAIKGIANVFNALMAILKPIGAAFRSIFPATTGKQLYEMTIAFRNFTAGLKIGGDSAKKLQRTFAGVFAVLNIGKTIIVEAVKLLLRLFGVAAKGSSGFLDVTASIGDWLVQVDKAITKGGFLHRVFTKIGDVIEVPIRLIKQFAGALSSAFGNIDFGSIGASLSRLISPLKGLAGLGDLVKSAWDKVTHTLDIVWNKFVDFVGNIGSASGGLGKSLASGFTNVNFDTILATLNTGLFAAVVLLLRKFVKSVTSALSGLGGQAASGGGIMDTIKDSFGQLTNTLKSMQNTLNATTLLAIAAAIGILTLSVVALSKIDAGALTKALSAISVMVVQLVSAMAVLSKLNLRGGFTQLIPIAAAMILLATAVNILASAVKKLADLSWEELSKGLIGVTVLIGALAGAVKLMSGNTGGMIAAGAGLILLAIGIKILAGSVEIFAKNSWGDIAKGLVSITAILAVFAVFSKAVGNPAALMASGAALILISVAMNILAKAIEKFGGFSWEVIGKGLLTMAGALAIIAAALFALPPTTILSAAAILVLATSLGMIADALKKFSGMSWEEIAKGLVTLAGSLLIIAAAMIIMKGALPGALATVIIAHAISDMMESLGGLNWEEIAKGLVVLAGSLAIIAVATALMTGSIAGAAALVVVSAALAILTPVLLALGSMSWESIGKGLATLAAAFIIFGVAGALLTPVIPTLLGLAAAIAIMGVGMALAGVGTLAFATGLAALAVAGAAASAAIIGIVKGLVGLIPFVMQQIGLGLVAFAKVIATAGPAITNAITTVLTAFLNAIIKITPKIVTTLIVMLTQMLKALDTMVPKMIATGIRIILAFLTGISQNVGKITTLAIQIVVNFINALTAGVPNFMAAATRLIVAFIQGISKNIGKIVDAGVKLVISLVNGVADAIEKNSTALGQAGGRVGVAIVKGMGKAIAGGIGEVTKAARDLAGSAMKAAKSALGVGSPSKEFEAIGKFAVDGFLKGLGTITDPKSLNKATVAFQTLTTMLRDSIKSNREDVKKAREDVKKLTLVRREDTAEINKAKAELDKLTSAHKPNKDAIERAREKLHRLTLDRNKDTAALNKAKHALDLANSALNKSSNAYEFLTTKFVKQRAALTKLATQYEVVTDKLAAANKVLEDATKTRDDFSQATQQGFDTLPEIAEDTNLADYQKGLQQQINDTQTFATLIQKLRDLGLNDTLYKELLTKGTSALPFISQILAGGQKAIDELNSLSGMLTTVATDLGLKASKALYQAGVDSAKGLVNGLKSQQAAIEKQMDAIANTLINSIKKRLGIKSPSKIFSEIGRVSIEGLANGLRDYGYLVEQSANDVGKSAIFALSKTISGMSDIIANEIDTNPTITPILDLTDMQKEASRIGSIITAPILSPDTSYSTAKNVSAATQATQTSTDTIQPTALQQGMIFNQYNTSPKALSSAEIYRQTKNQLSIAKGALT